MANYKLSSSSSFSLPFLPVFILPTTRKLPCYKALKEKQPQKGQKRRGPSLYTNKKRPDCCVNTPCSKPYNNTETCINTGFNQNCCHCFLSKHKINILFLFLLLFSLLYSCKVPKSPILYVFKRKKKT